ncbi:hypothetical protein POPTR_003G184250v4 [Populus trichocarpa]|uniref:Uncharacterized protein n=1 Tax=Populus trichocarpa TaxID=3694 RepID=A0ACC0TA72_POPTR|nr:hypothetical protein POPTR_003G184250v4 [Populus trichocarpa]
MKSRTAVFVLRVAFTAKYNQSRHGRNYRHLGYS